MSKRAERITKQIAVATMVLSAMWLVGRWKEPGIPWDAVLALLGGVGTYITFEVRDKGEIANSRGTQLRNDALLFSELVEVLPSHTQ